MQSNQFICREQIPSHKVIQVWHQVGLADIVHWVHDIHKYAYPGGRAGGQGV